MIARTASRSLLAAALALVALSSSATAQAVFRVVGDPTQMVPPTQSGANCSGTFFLAKGANQISYTVVIGNIGNDAITAADVRQGLPGGASGGLLFALTKVGAQFSGTSPVLNAQQIAAIVANGAHVVVKTQNFPNGAIRGPIATGWRQFWALGTGTQVVPQNASPAKMVATFTLNQDNSLTYFVSPANLLAPPTGCRIQNAAVGANGPVQFQLMPGQFPPEYFGVTAVLTNTQVAKLRTGQFYVIMSTMAFPAGECRGQIWPTCTSYGTSCPSSNGLCVLDGYGLPTSSQTFTFNVAKAKKSSTGLLLVSTDSANQVLAGGCVLYGKAPPVIVFPMTANATGDAFLNVPLPPLLPAFNVYCQFGGADAGVVGGLYLTNGLQVLVK